MKKLVLLLAILLASIVTPAQHLPSTDYLFTTQSQIDSFAILHPSLTFISGSIIINGGDITNLLGLSSITKIYGDLSIYENPMLHDLQGLNALTLTGGDFTLISENPVLENLTGLNSLKKISGGFMIRGNESLLNLNGIDSLEECLSLNIEDNFSLSSIDGLNSLWVVRGAVSIMNNPALTNLNGLSALQGINGNLAISDNSNLNSLEGIDNLDEAGIINLAIYNNSSLSYCAVASICALLASPNGGDLFFYNNLTGCNTAEEVQAECTAIGQNEKEIVKCWKVSPNPVDDFINVTSTVVHPNATIELFNLYGQRCFSAILPAGLGEERFDIATLSPGLYVLRIKSEHQADFVVKVLVR